MQLIMSDYSLAVSPRSLSASLVLPQLDKSPPKEEKVAHDPFDSPQREIYYISFMKMFLGRVSLRSVPYS